MAKKNKATVRAFEHTLISGLQTHLGKRAIAIAGAQLKTASVIAQVREHLATLDAMDTAKAEYLAIVARERVQRGALAPVVAGVRNFLLSLYSESSAEFRSFGFVPRANAVRSVETKASAVAKMRATRAARHTLGRRQKVSIVGTIDVAPSSVLPPSAPPAVANGTPVNGANAH